MSFAQPLIVQFCMLFFVYTGMSQDNRLVQISVDDRLSKQFIYDASAKLLMVKDFDEDQVCLQTIELGYDALGSKRDVLWKSPGGKFMRREKIFWDASGNLARREIALPGPDGVLHLHVTETCDNDPSQIRPLKRILFHDENGKVDSFRIFHYTDSLGSVVALSYSNRGQVLSTETVKRMAVPNPEYGVLPTPDSSPWMIERRTIVYANGRVSPQSFHTQVSVNNEKLPVEVVRIYHDGTREVVAYQYASGR